MTRTPRSASDNASGRPTRPRPTTAAVGVMAESLRLAAARYTLLAVKLPPEPRQEARVVIEIPGQQPARLLGDPVDPLESALLHPRRRLRHALGLEVEGSADGADHGRIEPIPHARHPLLLLRHTDAHPHDVGTSGVDVRHHLVLIPGRELAEGRRVATD